MEEWEKVCTIALNKIFTYNPEGARDLVEQAGSAAKVFEFLGDKLPKTTNNQENKKEVATTDKLLEEAYKELEWARQNDIELLFAYDKEGDYPERLLMCNDFPLLLYKRGNLTLNQPKVLGIVGTRRATSYGKSILDKIVEEVSQTIPGTAIVSGLAYGIDIEAHLAAMKYKLPTFAILGCAPDKVYPASHTSHAKKIISQGALVTEFPRKSEGYKINFLRRNRIIAGLCDAIIMVESGIKGGSTITASLAMGYNREVFAVPGRVTDSMSQGCNYLISENRASIFTSVKKIAEVIGWGYQSHSSEPEQKELFGQNSTEKEKILLALESNDGLDIGSLVSLTGISASNLLGHLLELELDGKIASLPGKRYSVFK